MNIKFMTKAQVSFKCLFFGFYYLWLVSMFYFFLFPTQIQKTSASSGWLMIGYPLFTVGIIFMYAVLIWIFYLLNKNTDRKITFYNHIKLLLFPVGFVIGIMVLIIVVSQFWEILTRKINI